MYLLNIILACCVVQVEGLAEASKRPAELKQRLYTRVREDLRMDRELRKDREEITPGVRVKRPVMVEPRGRFPAGRLVSQTEAFCS